MYAIPSGYVSPDPILNTATVASATPDPAAANNISTATTGLGDAVTDLRVTKTNGVSSLVPGQTTTYTITLTNNGPTDAIGARLQDDFPAALTGVSWTCTASAGGVCGAASGSGDIDIATNVPVGASIVVTATGTVAASATGFLVNTATATPPAGLSVRSTPTATDTDELVPQADLSVTKSGPASVLLGGPITYTITVANAGLSDASNVLVEDLFPDGLAFVSNTGDCTTAFPCALGTVPAGATRTITATFLVPVGYAGPSPIVNVATVSAATPDPDASDNTATAETTLDRGADVAVIKSVSPAAVLVGEQATFTVTVSNAGPAQAQGLVVHDLLPEGLTLDSFAVSQGSYVPATGDWTVGALDAGQSATLTIAATLVVSGAVTNFATITAADQPDPDASNDSSAVEVNGLPAADIAVTKTVDNATPAVGTTVTFMVRATNRGPTGATGVVVTDALPAGLTLVSATPSQGTYTAPAWTVGALAADDSATLVIVATVDALGGLVNKAEKTQQVEADPNTANDSASVTLNAGASANLKVLKVATRSTVAVGEPLTFHVVVVNLGPSPATGVRVSDVLPPGLTFVSAKPAAGLQPDHRRLDGRRPGRQRAGRARADGARHAARRPDQYGQRRRKRSIRSRPNRQRGQCNGHRGDHRRRRGGTGVHGRDDARADGRLLDCRDKPRAEQRRGRDGHRSVPGGAGRTQLDLRGRPGIVVRRRRGQRQHRDNRHAAARRHGDLHGERRNCRGCDRDAREHRHCGGAAGCHRRRRDE